MREAPHGALWATVKDNLDGQAVPRQQLAPAAQPEFGLTMLAGQHGPTDIGIGPDQGEQPGRGVGIGRQRAVGDQGR